MIRNQERYDQLYDEMEIQINEFVEKCPGIRYNDLRRMLSMANGTMSRKLSNLEQKGKIRKVKDGGKTRYYPIEINFPEIMMISALRQKTTRDILEKFSSNNSISFQKLVSLIDKSPSTLSAHLKRLQESGILKKSSSHNFTLASKEKLEKLLHSYKNSFIDGKLQYPQVV